MLLIDARTPLENQLDRIVKTQQLSIKHSTALDVEEKVRWKY